MSNLNYGKRGTGRISRRGFLKLGGTTAAGILLASCAPKAAPAPAATQAAVSKWGRANLNKLQLGYDNPNWSHQVADYVAREKGWFKEVGLDDVSLIIFDDSLTAIIGGGVNLTAADTDAIIEAHVQKGVDAWCLGTRRDKEDMIFGLAPGVSLDDLKGSKKQVSGGLVGSRNEIIGKKMLAELGLDPENDVEWITLGGGSDTRLAALLNGNLAGSNLQIRHIKTLEEAGGTIVYNKRRTIAQEFYVAMGDFIEKNADTVQAFMTTIVRAKQYLKDLNNKDEVISIMEKNGFEFSQEFRDAYADGIEVLSADAGFEIPEMQVIWDELAQTGEVPADFAWRDGLKLDFLWKAQELNGLPRRPASL